MRDDPRDLSTACYPWFARLWEQLANNRQADHMAHALLFTGGEGIGRRHFVDRLVASLLCNNITEEGRACGQCQACQVHRGGAHPDYLAVGLPEGKKQIPVAAIRTLTEFLTLSCSYGGFRVVFIDAADQMNVNAANSLLKSLEEPPPNTVIILLAEQSLKLPITIRSRCQQYTLATPIEADSLAWLAQYPLKTPAEKLLSIAANRPLLALNFDRQTGYMEDRHRFAIDIAGIVTEQKSITVVAKAWEKYDLNSLLDWQLQWLHQLFKNNLIAPQKIVDNKLMSCLASAFSTPDKLWVTYERLIQMKKLTDYPLNRLIFNEAMLLSWVDTP
ncbi:MAG TPA: hypothetical protein EYH35_02970 [Thiotrichaceae bacterium]|nr:hypothetical protein [Thiotrichaceae bacterium]